MKAEDIYQYYLSEDFTPELPVDFKFKHFRFKLADGSWRKVKERISNIDDLKKQIIKIGALDIYYSTAYWLNPHKVSTKKGPRHYMVADNVIFGQDLIFDVDAEEPLTDKGLDLARKSANNIYEGMKNYSDEYKFEYFAFTGLKGFRLVYSELDNDIPRNPHKRFDHLEKKRKVFIDKLLEYIEENKVNKQYYNIKTFFDEKVTINPMSVIRIIGSAHSTTGYISSKIPPSWMKKSFEKIIQEIKLITKGPGILKKEMTQEVQGNPPRTRLLNKVKDVTGPASLPHDIKYFITNKVLGIKKGFVPLFIYQENQTYFRKEIISLQKKYKLGHLYVFKHRNEYIIMSLKTMQKRQLQKILNKSSSKTKHLFNNHSRIFVPFLIDFVEKIKGDFTGNISLGHKLFAEPDQNENRKFCVGWEKIEFIRASKYEV